MASGSRSLNLFQRICCPSGVCGKIWLCGSSVSISMRSISNSFSSSERMNMRYVSWLITSMGLVMPLSHIFCQTSSTLFFVAPVIMRTPFVKLDSALIIVLNQSDKFQFGGPPREGREGILDFFWRHGNLNRCKLL